MSRYSTQLRFIVDMYGLDEVKSWFSDYDLSDYLTDDEIAVIESRGTWSKDKLAQKIIDHYFIKEIGYETGGLFKQRVKIHMKEIMEEYAPLIYSASIEYDPLVNVDFTETFNQSQNGTSNSTSETNSDGISIQSDTPQGQISKSAILAGNYATSTDGSESSATASDTSETQGTTEYTRRTKGNSGVSATAQRMVAQYRDNIRAIDREIIEHLVDDFMGIY